MRRIKSGLPIRDIVLTGWMPSGMKRWWYGLKGYRIHPTVRLGLGSVIVAENVEIGPETRIGLLTIIKGHEIKIGPRVRIGHFSVLDTFKLAIGEGTRVGNQVVVGGLETPRSEFKIGRNCILMEWSFINTTLPVLVGDDVGIGGHCLFFTHGLWPNTFEGFPSKFGSITIEDKAWLAWRVSVLPGVTIGTGSIISSDACVTKSVPAYALAAGVPAKVLAENGSYIGEVTPEKNLLLLKKEILEFSEWMTFNGATVQSNENGDISIIKDHPKTSIGRILIATDDSEIRKITIGDTYISVSGIEDKVRANIEQNGGAWMDIERRERSLSGDELTNEFEEFMRRAGLRLSKYGVKSETTPSDMPFNSL